MRLAILAVGAFLALPLSMTAETVYNYTGTDYTYSDVNAQPVNPPGTIAAPYSSTDSVTGFFTVSAPLISVTNDFITPDSYSFSDGAETITNGNGVFPFFIVSTDGTGAITSWTIEVTNSANANDFIISQSAPGSPADFAKIFTNGEVVSAGTNTTGSFGAPVPAAATPEPSSLALLGTGVAGLFTQVRRRMRRA